MRALKRANDERELASVKQKDIEKLQAEIDDLKQKREELSARNAKYTDHRKYLEKVCLRLFDLFIILCYF
jgi:cell division protein FtsB